MINRYCKILIAFLVFTFCQTSFADALYSILNGVHHLESLGENSQSGLYDMVNSQHDIENLMKSVNTGIVGHSGWGTYQTHDYQSYGESAIDWNDVMHLAESGGGSGDLGSVINAIAKQFPINQNDFNRGITNSTQQQYYAVQSQTVLATRAASQLDYDKIQNQIAYQRMLQEQIENANDLKSAVDLNNRIQVEANLINLEMLRQQSLANQQNAIDAQANINNALLHAKFLTKSN